MFDSDYVTASFDTLMKQAPDAVALYLQRAKDEIDTLFGEGYAAENPQLVAAFINAAASDMNAATLSKTIGNSLQEISSSLNKLANSLESE